MNPTTKSMTSIQIETHLRNQINSLNKEIHTKQGIIGKVQGIQSAQGLNLSLGGVQCGIDNALSSKPSKKSKDITSNNIWISVRNTGLSNMKWNRFCFICENFRVQTATQIHSFRDELKRARKDRLKITNEFLDVVKLLQRQVSKLNTKGTGGMLIRYFDRLFSSCLPSLP